MHGTLLCNPDVPFALKTFYTTGKVIFLFICLILLPCVFVSIFALRTTHFRPRASTILFCFIPSLENVNTNGYVISKLHGVIKSREKAIPVFIFVLCSKLSLSLSPLCFLFWLYR